ncbi:hypothetical protein [Helicobacter sp. MIT 01-3238]|uniref:hypothetical protein n=1 Tax=Helicobacter sp. MIT 01-3238 TaxID=398627 RepID=UPI0015F1A376|nr:hypothetical protein [Helicobacter sp. MIT 01-3238]
MLPNLLIGTHCHHKSGIQLAKIATKSSINRPKSQQNIFQGYLDFPRKIFENLGKI